MDPMTTHLRHPNELPHPATWVGRALCAEADPALWFGDRGGNHYAEAIAICLECPVREICLETAIARERTVGLHEVYGVLGGMTAKARKKILRTLPRLCIDCPAVKAPHHDYCDPCAARHRKANHDRRNAERQWAVA